jgi:hypothetical protein
MSLAAMHAPLALKAAGCGLLCEIEQQLLILIFEIAGVSLIGALGSPGRLLSGPTNLSWFTRAETHVHYSQVDFDQRGILTELQS